MSGDERNCSDSEVARTMMNLMKKSILPFLLISICTLANAQVTNQFGVKGGINVSRFSKYYNEASFKPGVNLGGYTRLEIKDNIHVRPELYFSSQGQKNLGKYQGAVTRDTKKNINALNIPVLFEWGRELAIQVGPQLGVLMSGREKGTEDSQKVDRSLTYNMNSLDLAIVIGFGVYTHKNFNVGGRFNYALTSTFVQPDPPSPGFPKYASRVLHFYVAWTFDKKN